MVNYQIKSQLARLLATEDLVVENRDVETASFDVDSRVLVLPLWKKASSTVYDMLVGHEVGHALFTPNRMFPPDLPAQFLNVTEDARIEKLMKRKYPGIAKSFYYGYKELNNDDFFNLVNQDITDLNLADRANLHFKVGHFLNLDFSLAEEQIISLIESAETWDQAVEAARALYEYCSVPVEDKIIEPPSDDDGDFGEEFFDDGVKKEEPVEPPTPKTEVKEPEVKTDKALSDNLKYLNDMPRRDIPNIYCEVPEVNLDTVVVPNERVHQELQEGFDIWLRGRNVFKEVDQKYVDFKRSSQKEVNYLVKEFECKKAADAYSRTSVSKTGVLNCSKLHNYKFDEDLFRKVNIIPDGKNHGLIFILDWSGSMSECMVETINQLYNLVWFCKKVQIPFEVYAFTNCYGRGTFDDEGNLMPADPHVEKKENDLVFDDHFSLLNFLSSKVSKAKLEKQMINLWRTVWYFRREWSVEYTIHPKYNLSGTPLNESLIALHQLIPQFKKDNNIQKVQCIILTDGEANHLPVWRGFDGEWDPLDKVLRARKMIAGRTYLRSRKTGHTYAVPSQYWEFTEVLLTDLKEIYPEVNFVGIRLCSSREFNSFIRRYEYISDDKLNRAKKEKSYAIQTSGYHSYFAIISSSLYNEEEFEVAEDATKAQIKRAFAKSLKTKKLNKKVLGEFISLVA